MKGTSCALLLAAAFVAVGYAFPRTPADSEMLFVPLESREAPESTEDVEVTDDGFGMRFLDFSELFGGFIKRIHDLVKGVSIDVLDGMKGNTTSTSKVVGDHVWIINDTVYGDEDKGVYHVQTILVRPVDETIENGNPLPSESTGNDTPATPEKPTESSENEIPKEKIGDIEDPFQSSSVTNKFVTSHAVDHWRNPMYPRPFTHENLDKYPLVRDLSSAEVDNKIDSLKPIDLSKDIVINDLMERRERGGLVNIDPDAELINYNDGTFIDPYSTMNRYQLPRYFF